MVVHLLKIGVGTEDVEHLRQAQSAKMQQSRAAGQGKQAVAPDPQYADAQRGSARRRFTLLDHQTVYPGPATHHRT